MQRTAPLLLLIAMVPIASTSTAQPYRWAERASFSGTARYDAVAFSVAGKGYVCTGLSDAGMMLNDLRAYDPASNSWSNRAPLPGAARRGAVAFTIGNMAYVATGHNGTSNLNDLWRYNPATNSWTARTALPAPARHYATSFAINGKGYVCAGWDGTTAMSDLWEYDPATNTWTQKAPLPGIPRLGAAAFTIGSTAYVAGGVNFDESLPWGMYAYDPVSDSWSVRADPADFVWFSSSYLGFALAGNGYFVTAGPSYDPIAQPDRVALLAYDPALDQWSAKALLAGIPRDGAIAFAVGNKGYVGLGSHLAPWYQETIENYRFSLNDLWAYDPFDCQGVQDGQAWPGAACDDGNAGTVNDVYTLNCTCAGSTQPMPLFRPDAIDATFNTGSGFDLEVKGLALQSDGKVIAVGAFTSFNGAPCGGIARLNADGSLDTTFTGAFGGSGVAIQADGKVLVGGTTIHRLEADGSLDPTFSVPAEFTGGSHMVVQSDGKILASGYYSDGFGDITPVVRFNSDGSIDPDFYMNESGFTALQVTLLEDQRFFVGGTGTFYNAGLRRYETNGWQDEDFSIRFGFGDDAPVNAFAFRADSGLIVGGDFSLFDYDPHEQEARPIGDVVRLTADGSLVTSFLTDNDGMVTTLVVGPDDRPLVGGDFTQFQGLPRNRIALLNKYGYPDASFDPGSGFNLRPNVMLTQPDGHLLIAGVFTTYNGVPCGRIIRLHTAVPDCAPTQLTTTANPEVSCGATGLLLNGTDTIWADEVPGANRYQFRFTNTAGQPAYTRNIAFSTRGCALTQWATKPLKPGRTYNVQVRASFDEGATWCAYSSSCTVSIGYGIAPIDVRMADAPPDMGGLLLAPNPHGGGPLLIQLQGLDEDLEWATFDLLDATGRAVDHRSLRLQHGVLSGSFDLRADLPAGLYVVRITAGGQYVVAQLAVTR